MRTRSPKSSGAWAALPSRLILCGLVAAMGCAAPAKTPTVRPNKPILTVAEMRRELELRVPERPRDDLPVLWEVDPETVDRLRQVWKSDADPSTALHDLVRLITAIEGLGLRYDRAQVGHAREAIASGSGNCLSLAAVLVGVARELGIRAMFTSISQRDEVRFYEGDVAIVEEHMGAKLRYQGLTLYVDYSGRLRLQSRVRTLDDLRATAHYLNNRAYELVHASHADAQPIPWPEVARRFELATRVAPGLHQIWNNLGVALGRSGQPEAARAAYRRALVIAPEDPSARRNLELLQRNQALWRAAQEESLPAGPRGL